VNGEYWDEIMIDTSVWLECREDEELRTIVKDLINKHELRSSEIIEDEVKDSYIFLNQKKIAGAEILNEIYLTIKKPVIKETDAIKKLVYEYEVEAKKVGIVAVKSMKADFTIVASATLDGVNFILTLNRKTMASDFARLVYSIVSTRKELKTPEFIIGKEAIRGLLMLSLSVPLLSNSLSDKSSEFYRVFETCLLSKFFRSFRYHCHNTIMSNTVFNFCNLGIGTTGPSSLLHVNSTSANTYIQFPVNRSALASRTKLAVKDFKCAWFDDRHYYEFFPLHAVYPK